MDLFGSSDSEEEAATETVSVSSSASPTTATAAVETEPSEPPAPAGDSEESELTSQSEATTESEVTEVIEDEPVTDSDASSSEVVAESRSEPASGLPPAVGKIEGLAVVEGLARAGGDAKAYLKALKSFAETEAGTPEQIRDALERGDSNNADKLAHELARTAAEIGAGAVHDAAMAVGRAIEGQVEPDRLEFLWADLDRALRELVTEIKAALRPREEKPAAPRAVRPPPPINLAEFRKAVHTIVPLFAGQDPGAKDCFKDHRAVFRSAFSAEAYAEFEQLVKKNAFDAALEHLKKTAKRHGVAV
jgi:HPt (histidine-containing phosphotransfer) domain-containing protein